MVKACLESSRKCNVDSKKLELRTYSDVHIPQTVEWLKRSDIREFFGITYDVNDNSHKKWLSANPHVEFLALYSDGEYVGNIVLNHNQRHFSTNLQIYLGSDKVRGQGLGTGFMKLALSYVFHEKKQNRIWLHVREYNEPAKRMYKSLGFKSEGLERQSIWTGKEFINQELMGLLKQDWKVV